MRSVRWMAVVGVVALAALAWAQYPSMAGVRRIYIDKLGNNDDAERFRSVAAQELNRAGFNAVSSADPADAVMKGSFTFANYGEKSGGQANVRMMSRDEKEIWSGSVADKIHPGKDSTGWVAQELAKTLKSRKSAIVRDSDGQDRQPRNI